MVLLPAAANAGWGWRRATKACRATSASVSGAKGSSGEQRGDGAADGAGGGVEGDEGGILLPPGVEGEAGGILLPPKADRKVESTAEVRRGPDPEELAVASAGVGAVTTAAGSMPRAWEVSTACAAWVVAGFAQPWAKGRPSSSRVPLGSGSSSASSLWYTVKLPPPDTDGRVAVGYASELSYTVKLPSAAAVGGG